MSKYGRAAKGGPYDRKKADGRTMTPTTTTTTTIWRCWLVMMCLGLKGGGGDAPSAVCTGPFAIHYLFTVLEFDVFLGFVRKFRNLRIHRRLVQQGLGWGGLLRRARGLACTGKKDNRMDCEGCCRRAKEVPPAYRGVGFGGLRRPTDRPTNR
uniref:Uncharacterized protein n=1 Tax=Anopheles farauti TaxID=69004 RepID=A0A182QVV1_9DIPT